MSCNISSVTEKKCAVKYKYLGISVIEFISGVNAEIWNERNESVFKHSSVKCGKPLNMPMFCILAHHWKQMEIIKENNNQVHLRHNMRCNGIVGVCVFVCLFCVGDNIGYIGTEPIHTNTNTNQRPFHTFLPSFTPITQQNRIHKTFFYLGDLFIVQFVNYITKQDFHFVSFFDFLISIIFFTTVSHEARITHLHQLLFATRFLRSQNE